MDRQERYEECVQCWENGIQVVWFEDLDLEEETAASELCLLASQLRQAHVRCCTVCAKAEGQSIDTIEGPEDARGLLPGGKGRSSEAIWFAQYKNDPVLAEFHRKNALNAGGKFRANIDYLLDAFEQKLVSKAEAARLITEIVDPLRVERKTVDRARRLVPDASRLLPHK